MSYTLLEDEPKVSKPKFTLLDDAQDPTGSFAQNLAAGAGKAVVDAGRGVKQMLDVPAQWLEKKFGTLGTEKLGLPTAQASAAQTQADVDESRRLDAPLMDTGGGVAGNIAGNVAMTVVAPGSTSLRGAAATGAVLGAAQPTSGDESRLVNTAIGGVGGAGGKVIGDKVAGLVANRLASKTAEAAANKTQNASRDATLSAGRDAGYVVPPTQANPSSAWNQLLEGISGKIKTSQVASQKNQEVTNKLARQSIGLAEDQPITAEALKATRSQAGQAYEAIAGAGEFITDGTFKQRIGQLSASQKTLFKEVPELADKEVLNLAQSLDRESFDGKTLIEMSKALRERATAAFKSGSSEAGRFYRGAAVEVEDLIERNFLYTGKGGEKVLEAFQNARSLIAKTYSIEAALNDATGAVNAHKLAAQLNKGKPLSGELKTAAEFGQAFPKATQEIRDSVPATSPLDWYASVGTSAASGSPLPMALAAARPTIRSMLLSKPYQSAMAEPTYRVSDLLRLGEGAINNPVTRRLNPGAGTVGALYLNK